MMWKGESFSLCIFVLIACIFVNFLSRFLTQGRRASTDLVMTVVMGVCKPKQVKLMAHGGGCGGSEGQQSCASTGLDKERMVAGSIEQDE